MKKRRNKSKIEKLQAFNAYLPCKRLCTQCLSYNELQKLNAGLANDISYGWELTLNVRVLQPKTGKFHIVLLSRGRKSDKKGKKVASQYYDSKLLAENNIFSFRKSHESQAAKRKLDVWETVIGSEKENDVLIVNRETNIQSIKALYKKKLKSTRFTGNLCTEHHAPKINLNPNNHRFGVQFLTEAP